MFNLKVKCVTLLMVRVVVNNKGVCISYADEKTDSDNEKVDTVALFKKIRKDLIVTEKGAFKEYNARSYSFYKECKKYIIVPIYYFIDNLIKACPLEYALNFVDTPVLKQESFSNSISLRHGQTECYNTCIKEFSKPFGGGIILMTTGSGKTLTSLKIMCFLKKKTLIIVDKKEHIAMWRKEINKWIPNARIGFIGGPKFQVDDCDIVLGMLQTTSIKKTLTYKDFLWVELAIFDEVHHITSEVFSNVMFKIRPRYVFGLTATLERKDGMETAIKWYMGSILYSNTAIGKKQETDIHCYKYKGESSVPITLKSGDVACSAMVTAIANDTARSDIIIKIINKFLLDPERNILVLSDRIVQLKYINKLVKESSLYIGKMTTEQLEESKKARVLLGTFKLAGEGFSHEKLNTLVLGTPKASLVQAIGRIYRKTHDTTPVIVDVYDDFSYFKNQYYKRRKVYKDEIIKCNFKNFDCDFKIEPVASIDVDANQDQDFSSDSD